MGSLWILKTRKPWTDRAGCAEPANAANAQGPDGSERTPIGETRAGFVRDFGAVRQKSRERVSIEDQLRERWLTAIKEFGADAALRDASEAFALRSDAKSAKLRYGFARLANAVTTGSPS